MKTIEFRLVKDLVDYINSPVEKDKNTDNLPLSFYPRENISDRDLDELITILPHCPNGFSLFLCAISMRKSQVKKLNRALKNNQCPQNLKIHKNEIDADDFKALANVLETNTKIIQVSYIDRGEFTAFHLDEYSIDIYEAIVNFYCMRNRLINICESFSIEMSIVLLKLIIKRCKDFGFAHAISELDQARPSLLELSFFVTKKNGLFPQDPKKIPKEIIDFNNAVDSINQAFDQKRSLAEIREEAAYRWLR